MHGEMILPTQLLKCLSSPMKWPWLPCQKAFNHRRESLFLASHILLFYASVSIVSSPQGLFVHFLHCVCVCVRMHPFSVV